MSLIFPQKNATWKNAAELFLQSLKRRPRDTMLAWQIATKNLTDAVEQARFLQWTCKPSVEPAPITIEQLSLKNENEEELIWTAPPGQVIKCTEQTFDGTVPLYRLECRVEEEKVCYV